MIGTNIYKKPRDIYIFQNMKYKWFLQYGWKTLLLKKMKIVKKKNAFYLVIWGLNFLTGIGGQTTVLIVQKGSTTSNAVVLSSFSSDVHSV